MSDFSVSLAPSRLDQVINPLLWASAREINIFSFSPKTVPERAVGPTATQGNADRGALEGSAERYRWGAWQLWAQFRPLPGDGEPSNDTRWTVTWSEGPERSK